MLSVGGKRKCNGLVVRVSLTGYWSEFRVADKGKSIGSKFRVKVNARVLVSNLNGPKIVLPGV